MKRASLLFSLSLVSAFLISNRSEAQVLTSFDRQEVTFSNAFSLGYAFSSSSSTSITALGFWDSNGDGFSGNHQVGLWDAGGVLLGLVNLSQGTSNTLVGEFRYANLASSVSLNAGSTYFIAGTTASDDWVYEATNITMGSGFSYLGSYFDSDLGGLDATFPDAFASSREYLTVNALSTTTTVPEPSSLALLCAGVAGLGVIIRRRRTA